MPETWAAPDDSQKTFRGWLCAVHGPLVLWELRDHGSRFGMLDKLAPADAVRVDDFLTKQPRDKPSSWAEAQSQLTKELRPLLVILRDGKLVPFEPGDRPEPRFYGIYYSAGWCGPCHAFTPKLVQEYLALKAAGENSLEIIFVSSDESAGDMRDYMREMAMPWPALRWRREEMVDAIARQEGPGIPCLVVLDRDGNLLFHSYRGKEYLGADEPLQQIKSLLSFCKPGSREMAGVWYRFQRLVYLERNKSATLPPKPYAVHLNPARFREAGVTHFELRLSIADDGTVISAEASASLPPALAWQAAQEARRWLFLPQIKNGRYCTADTVMPIDIPAASSSKE